MKKLFFALPITMVITLSLIYSCNKVKDESVKEIIELKNTDNLNFYGYNYKPYQEHVSSKDIVIIRVKLWRKSEDCLRKLGVCKVQFFPIDKSLNLDDIGREIDIPITSSFDGGILNIFFAEDVSKYTIEDLKLYVDGDIFIEDSNDIFESSYKVPDGVYMYDSTIGDFGGYSITIIKKVS
ncbi:MAG: hypothetical protein H3C40_14980 [Ignavibacterium sp.]|jgi:hypothetical protein|nr:hypothetical protein [Ignavibacterium sp.]